MRFRNLLYPYYTLPLASSNIIYRIVIPASHGIEIVLCSASRSVVETKVVFSFVFKMCKPEEVNSGNSGSEIYLEENTVPEKVCFICEKPGDPIENKLKT